MSWNQSKNKLVVIGYDRWLIFASLSIDISFSLHVGFVDVLAAAGSGSEV